MCTAEACDLALKSAAENSRQGNLTASAQTEEPIGSSAVQTVYRPQRLHERGLGWYN